ncbi:Probable polyphosphate glucokinase PpgK [Mycobacteroides abscessus]|nr:Probable polyphosphate glucokinase PpgK [Mycobacteroides abscessus]
MTATDSAPAATAADPSHTPQQAFGIDVGGSGIKGAIVDLTTGG